MNANINSDSQDTPTNDNMCLISTPVRQSGPVSSDITRTNSPTPTKSVTFASVNLRSLTHKKCHQVYDLIETENIDILFMNETWLNNNETENVHKFNKALPAGYTVIGNKPRQSVHRGGGVAFAVKQSSVISTTVKNDVYSSMECVQMSASFINGKSVQIVGIYRPPDLPLPQFFIDFESIFSDFIVTDHDQELLIFGDLNIRVDEKSYTTAKFLALLADLGLYQWVEGSTHRNGHTLDLIITTMHSDIIESISRSSIVQSDHLAVVAKSKLYQNENVSCPEKLKSRNWSKVNVIELAKKLNEVLLDWNYKNIYSVDDLAETLCCIFTDIADEFAPLCDRNFRNNPRPWYSKALQQLKKQRRKLERQWRSNGLASTYEEYTTKAKEVAEEEISAKKDYFLSKMNTTNPKILFENCKKLLCGPKKEIIYPKNFNNNILANKFNYFFIEKVENVRSSLQIISTNFCCTVSDCVTFERFKTITIDEVIAIIKQCNNKTCELDILPTCILSNDDVLSVIAPVLNQIVNASLITSVIPECFKYALVTPILKKPTFDTNDMSSFRPISNLCFISKVLERVISNQLVDHLESNLLLSKFQSGFRKAHGVETALLRVFNDIYIARDSGLTVGLALLDISAAFDTLDHSLLFEIMELELKVTGIALEWFKNYLKCRYQTVKIKDSKSCPLELQYGVPQGSILGPILFSIYLIPLYIELEKLDINYHGYADDNQLYIIDKSNDACIDKLSSVVKLVTEWCTCYKLKINPNKTNVMIIPNKNHIETVNFDLNFVTVSTQVRNLGFVLDENLKLDKQISLVCRNSFYFLKNISQNKQCFDNPTLEKAILSYGFSHINFCAILYYDLPEKLTQKLQSIQNYAVRIIMCLDRKAHITPALKTLKWLNVKNFILYRYATIVYKCLTCVMPKYLTDLLLLYVPNRPLRSQQELKLVVPFCKKKLGDRAFCIAGPKIWNNLPENVRLSPTINIFKSKLKNYLLEYQFQNQ